jgi:hypothetical protein
MAATKYTYSISTAFPNHAVAPDRLLHEIQASAITVAVDRVDTSGDDCDVWFKAELGAEDLAALNSIVAAHSGIPLPEAPSQVMIAGSTTVLPIQALPPAGLKSNQISQNWCDKTTWWYSSIKVTDEVATTTDPERKIWKVVHPFMIDVCHGKLTGERTLTSHRVAVTVGGVAKTEQDPHHGTGDYVVDYAAGTLTFTDAIADGVSPLVSYHYENGSTWIIKPTAGETWRLKGAESQFSDDVIMNDAMVYEIWVITPPIRPTWLWLVSPTTTTPFRTSSMMPTRRTRRSRRLGAPAGAGQSAP